MKKSKTKQGYLICHNCGAKIEVLDAECPYCRAINYAGAEAEYFKNLNKIKDNLKELDRTPGKVYKAEMASQMKKIIMISAALVSVFVLILVGIKMFHKQGESKQEDEFADPKEQILWDQENFPKLNRWYEEGEYDQLLENLMTLLESEKPFTYINWPHGDFLVIYSEYREVMDVIRRMDNHEECSKYQITSSLYGALRISFHLEKESLDKEELERAKVFQEDANRLLYDKFKLTEEQVLQIYEDISQSGFMDYEKAVEYAVDIMKDL